MRDAEDGVDQLNVDFTGRQLEQGRFHRIERLETLFEEDFVELGQIDGHAAPPGLSSSAPTASSWMALSSLAERPVQP